MPARDYLQPCPCQVKGAGATVTDEVRTPQYLLDAPESSYPVGSQATLAAPFPVDRGLWVEPRLVSVFVKTPNGRWTSYPGNDVNYPSLGALAMAAPVVSVYSPGTGSDGSHPDPAATPAKTDLIWQDQEPYPMATVPAAAPAVNTAALRKYAPWIAGAALLFFFFRKGR